MMLLMLVLYLVLRLGLLVLFSIHLELCLLTIVYLLCLVKYAVYFLGGLLEIDYVYHLSYMPYLWGEYVWHLLVREIKIFYYMGRLSIF